MTVALISINTYSTDIEYLGIASIASYLREKGEIVHIYDFSVNTPIDKIIEKIGDDYQLYGFSLFHTNAERIYQISEALKSYKQSIKIFAGGYLATYSSYNILNDCPAMDFIVLGDGEYTLNNVIKTMQNNGDISALASVATRYDKKVKVASCIDITDMPWPARDYIEKIQKKNKYVMARISTSRGCCADCSFCQCNSYMKSSKTKRWQGRVISDVFNEIVHIYERYGVRCFSFNDGSIEDPGTLGKERLKQLCNMLINYPVKFHFQCFIRAESFHEEDSELLQLMRTAGFSHFLIGIESANDSELLLYNKKANTVNNENIINLLNKYDIDFTIGFILFNPFSTKEALKKNHDFLTKHNLYYCCALLLEIYYNTSIYNTVKEKNMLKAEYSYLSPNEYLFQETEVKEIFDSIVKKFAEYNIEEIMDDFKNFTYFYYSIRVLYPDIHNTFKDKVNQLKAIISNVISMFMGHYYGNGSIKEAEEHFMDFEKSMNEFKLDFMKTRLKIMNAPPIKNIISNME